MAVRLVGWTSVALAVAVVLELVAPQLVLLAVPIAVVARVLLGWYRNRNRTQDAVEMLVSWAAALSGERTSSNGAQPEWDTAVRAELASISDPRERRRFALGTTIALVGTPRRRKSALLAAGAAVAFGAALMGYSRTAVAADGVGSVSMLLPPVMLFAIGILCARSTGSLHIGVETGILTAVASLVAMTVVFGVEAAHWFEVAHVSIFDGEHLDVSTARAAVFDAVHPVILLVHFLFWLPWPVLGARAGLRARRRDTPTATST